MRDADPVGSAPDRRGERWGRTWEGRPRRDLIVAGVARLFVQVAGVVTQTYLLYYFESVVPAAEHAALPKHIGHLLIVAFLIPLPAALILGRLSDLTQRYKPALLLSALIAAAGLVGMAMARSWAAAPGRLRSIPRGRPSSSRSTPGWP